MKLALKFLFPFLFIGTVLYSQPLVIDWQQCYGGTEGEGGSGVIKIAGGYLFSGTTYSRNGNFPNTHGNGDSFLIWTDSIGNLTSVKTYGGTEIDEFIGLKAATGSGFVIFGSTFSNNHDVQGNHGSGDLWVVRVDDAGAILWQRCLGGSAIEHPGRNIELTTDSGFICAGATASNDGDVTGFHGFYDYWPVMLDKEGSLSWENCYGGTMVDFCRYTIPTPDGGKLLAGATDTPDGDVQCSFHGGTGDAWIVKLDSSGNIEWQNCYGGSGMDNLYDIVMTPDGGYLCAGLTNSTDGEVSGNHGSYDFWIVKLDASGTLIWQKCFGGSAEDYVTKIIPISDGNFLVVGNADSYDGDVTGNHSTDGFSDMWIIKISPAGQMIWEQCVGGKGDDDVGDLIESPNGEYTISGSTSSNDNSGDVNCNYHGGLSDIWLVHLIDTTYIGIHDVNAREPVFEVYPNPANTYVTVHYDMHATTGNLSMTIFNGIGRSVGTYNLKGDKGTFTIDLSGYSPGIYGYIVTNPIFRINGTFILGK